MKNIKEAIAHFNYGIKCDIFQEPVTSYAKVAISALEKQMPKKPVNQELKVYGGGTRMINADCPVCKQPVNIYDGHQNNKSFRRDEDVFCSYCGQALDWSDGE